MIDDPIVEEVRRARADYAAKFNYDLRAMCEDLRKRSQESGAATVTRAAPAYPTTPAASKKGWIITLVAFMLEITHDRA